MKISLERLKCIGCGSCAAVCPLFFEMAEDNKAHLINSQKDVAEIESLEAADPGCAREAADICPVQAIQIS